MEIKFNCNINPDKIAKKITENKEFWTLAHMEWWRLYKDYVPFQSGNLMRNVTVSETGIKHNEPYAHRQYEGDNFNFYRGEQGHPLASARWDKAAKPTQFPKLIRTLNGYIKSGRIKF